MSERSRDRSSSSGGDLSYFPWLSGDCGYGHYLSAADDRTWLQLLRRGAHGQGLLVSHLQPDFCCAGRSPRGAITDGTGLPWLLPALVRWTSPIDEEHMLTSAISMELDGGEREEFSHPPIIISDCFFLDAQATYETMPFVNLSWGQTADEVQALPDLGQFEGLAYPWQIVPLTEQAHDEILITMRAAMNSFQTWVLNEANCWIASYEDDDDELEGDPEIADDLPERNQPGVYEGHGCHECGHRLGEPKCDCGRWATKEQIYLSILSSDLAGKDFLPERYHPLWDYALNRYAVGWQTIAASMEQGDVWSTSCWSQHSPFSDGSSPAALLRALSQGSTPSPGSSASSAA